MSHGFILYTLIAQHPGLCACFRLAIHSLWLTSCKRLQCFVYLLTCSTLITMSDCMLKSVRVKGLLFAQARTKPVEKALSRQQRHITSFTEMHGNICFVFSFLYSAVDVTITDFKIKVFPPCLLSPVWGRCGLLVCLGGTWCPPVSSCWEPPAQSGSMSPSQDKTSSCGSCLTKHTIHRE